MIPLPLPNLALTHRTVNKSHPSARYQHPAQRPAVPEVRRRVDSETHEDVPDGIEHDEAFGKLPVRREGGDVELEEGERAAGLEAEFDAEAEEDGGDDAGGDAEVGGLGELGGGHAGLGFYRGLCFRERGGWNGADVNGLDCFLVKMNGSL